MWRLTMAAALLAMAGPAAAQNGEQLHSTYLSCSQFEKTPRGAWRAKSWMLLPCGVALSRRTPFTAGAIFCGRDLAAELDAVCGQ